MKMNTKMKITIASFLLGLIADFTICLTSNNIVYGVGLAVFFVCMLGFTLSASGASTIDCSAEDKAEEAFDKAA